jgi:hypothetical protein
VALINTLEAASEFDALATLRPGEPYFLLVGRDRFAPPLIDQWADKHRRKVLAEYAAGTMTREQRDDELRKASQAEEIAASMVEYKNRWEAQVKAEPGAGVSYTGHELPDDTQRRDRLQKARARASGAMHACIAELAEQLPAFEESALDDEVAALNAKMDNLRRTAELIGPKRPIPSATA